MFADLSFAILLEFKVVVIVVDVILLFDLDWCLAILIYCLLCCCLALT